MFYINDKRIEVELNKVNLLILRIENKFLLTTMEGPSVPLLLQTIIMHIFMQIKQGM